MDKLFTFLRRLFTDRFYGTVTIKFECGKVTHVEVETRRTWEYKDLPGDTDGRGGRQAGPRQAAWAQGGGHDAA